VTEEFEWRTDELKIFAKSLNSDKGGRALKLQMQSQFDSITETLRDRLRHGVGTLSGAGSYPEELADSVDFKTKIIGGKNARVTIVGEGRTRGGKWREVGKLLDDGFLFHPAWGFWRGTPPPAYLKQDVPSGPRMVTDVLDRSTPDMADQIRSVLTDYLDRLTDIRKA
jgi:hypothetical protein